MKLSKLIKQLFGTTLSMAICFGLTLPAMAWPEPPGAPILITGGTSTFVQKSDGTVWGWGDNTYNQLLLGDSVKTSYDPIRIAELSNLQRISANHSHVMVIKSDGTLWGWGHNDSGQLGLGHTDPVDKPTQVTQLTDVVDIIASSGYTIALLADGTLWSWGKDTNGSLGQGALNEEVLNPVKILDNATRVWSHWYTSYAETSDGSIYVWGQSGGFVEGSTNKGSPYLVPFIDNVVDLAMGQAHTVILLSDGSLKAWGRGTVGQLGNGTTNESTRPVNVILAAKVSQISASFGHSLALADDGFVWAWGRNEYYELGRITTDGYFSSMPGIVEGLDNVVAVATARQTSFAIREDGSLWSWGHNRCLGTGSTSNTSIPTFVMYLWGDDEDPDPTRIWVEVPVGGTVDLRATALHSEFEIKPAVWTSSNEPVATVDSEGVVYGVSPGIAFITAETLDGQHEATIGVLVVDSDIEAMRLEVKLRPGYSAKLVAADYNANISQDVVWTSADPVTVSVDTNGRVTAGDDRGAVTIVSATSQAGDYLGSVYVRVV